MDRDLFFSPAPPDPGDEPRRDEAFLDNTLTARDIALLKVAVAAAQNRTDDLRKQLVAALSNDVKPNELVELLEQAALHTGHRIDDQLAILGDAIRASDGPS
jgi:alkylhydroperoxidase/carboxymuconolactone decarboxylase family protein YurZ